MVVLIYSAFFCSGPRRLLLLLFSAFYLVVAVCSHLRSVRSGRALGCAVMVYPSLFVFTWWKQPMKWSINLRYYYTPCTDKHRPYKYAVCKGVNEWANRMPANLRSSHGEHRRRKSAHGEIRKRKKIIFIQTYKTHTQTKEQWKKVTDFYNCQMAKSWEFRFVVIACCCFFKYNILFVFASGFWEFFKIQTHGFIVRSDRFYWLWCGPFYVLLLLFLFCFLPFFLF